MIPSPALSPTDTIISTLFMASSAMIITGSVEAERASFSTERKAQEHLRKYERVFTYGLMCSFFGMMFVESATNGEPAILGAIIGTLVSGYIIHFMLDRNDLPPTPTVRRHPAKKKKKRL